MDELNNNVNSKVLTKKDDVISFKCELQENLQKAMKEFVEDHPNWDQYRILQAAIAGFLMQKGFQNRDCLLYTSPSPRDSRRSRMPSSA